MIASTMEGRSIFWRQQLASILQTAPSETVYDNFEFYGKVWTIWLILKSEKCQNGENCAKMTSNTESNDTLNAVGTHAVQMHLCDLFTSTNADTFSHQASMLNCNFEGRRINALSHMQWYDEDQALEHSLV